MSSIQVNFQIDNELLKDVDLVCGDWGRSEFIRAAIEEKLSRKKSEDNEILKILRQMDRLDPNAMHEDVKNLIINVTTLFELPQKQKRL